MCLKLQEIPDVSTVGLVRAGVRGRSFHRLRKRNDFPQSATVVLGPRCVRYRREALQAFALSFASAPRGEPEQLTRARRICSTR
jgi:hypothetical protein